jgi:predicted MFS family arabinose efflux permease
VVMAIKGIPLGVMIVLLVVAVFLGPAFSGAEVGYLAAALEPEAYRAGTALRLMTSQLAQVLGFAVGGALVVQLGSRGALLADAITYLLSAACIGIALPSTPAPRRHPEPYGSTRVGRITGLLWRDRALRRLVGLTWLAGLLVVPEGLAVPLGQTIDASTAQIGLMYASIPLGGALGAVLLMKAVRRRDRDLTAAWMAAGAGAPLVVSAASPGWAWILLTWFISGGLSAYVVEVTSTLAQQIPDEFRARLMGLVSAGLVGAQGVGLGVFGVVAQGIGAGPAISIAGGCAVAVGLVLFKEPRQAPVYVAQHADKRAASSS